MKVLILGSDGYLGHSLASHLLNRGHEILGVDNFLRRRLVFANGGQSIIPIKDRKIKYQFREGDCQDYDFIKGVIRDFGPETIVNMAQIPSAPFSMMSPQSAAFTQGNNIIGGLNVLHVIHQVVPDCPLISIGSMGTYGTPDIPITEFRNMPKSPGSFYHASKCAASINLDLACRIWGLRCTDVHQGVVFGVSNDTRFDIDEMFGTIINRFIAQAIVGIPLTVYGSGNQKRGFLPLIDSMNCLTLAIESPPEQGEYRILNQFDLVHSLNSLAGQIKRIGNEMGLNVTISHVPNPRVEAEEHSYITCRDHLDALGYLPVGDMDVIFKEMMDALLPHRSRIDEVKDAIKPKTNWK